MSELRIVKGNDFTTLYKITATYADGTEVEDFDLRSCTDVQVLAHKNTGTGYASIKEDISSFGSYTLEEDNILRIAWDGLLMKNGTYTVDFIAKFRGADIRSYSIRDLVFDIVETNEEANIPAGAFVDNGTYRFSGEFVLMFESQLQADWEQTDDTKPDYIKNKPTIPQSLSELSDDSEHRTVTDSEKSEWNNKGTYSKPQDGIPATDLTSSVQASLNKANTALQSESDPTVPSWAKASTKPSYTASEVGALPANTHIPTTLAELASDSTHRLVTDTEKATWNGKQDAINDLETIRSGASLGATSYQKPSTGIPASDIASGVIPDVSQFITRNVNNLVNYYLKSETYTQAEVQGLIAAINQFHYEIYPSTSSVTNPQGNVLYLIGPTGTGNDKYEEYVYANNTWVKIGDTSIDLSGYVTTQALNAALANYTTTADLNTLLAGKQDVLTFDNVPTEGSNNPVTSDGLHDVFEQIYEDYAKKDGFYENMLVGSALNLTDTTGAYIAREFYFSPAGGTNDIKTGSAFIKRIKGSTIVWNQLIYNGNFADGANGWSLNNSQFGTITTNNNTATITLTQVPDNRYTPLLRRLDANIVKDHYYLCKSEVYSAISTSWRMEFGGGGVGVRSGNLDANKWNRFAFIFNRIDAPTNSSFTIYPEYTNINDWQMGDTWSVRNVQCIDLTLMFGAGNEPATVAEFEAMFPLDYYDYNAGQLLSFTGDDIKTTGFNQWDEQWELGEINADTGANTDTSIVWRSKNYIPILPDTSYYAYCAVQGTPNFRARFYDANKNYIGYLSKSGQQITTNSVFTTPTNAHYLRFAPLISAVPTGTPVCVNISHNGTKNGTYEEYEQHTKDISFYKSIKDGQGNPLFPYGLLSAGSVYDEVTATKAIKRIGAVDLGSLSWTISTTGTYNRFYSNGIVSYVKQPAAASIKANIIADRYMPVTFNVSYGTLYDMTCAITDATSGARGNVNVVDSHYSTTAAFKTAMQGVMLYYELAEPIVVDITEQNMAYLVNDWGTEQLLPENTSAPVTTPAMLHVIYGMNAVDTLRNLPKNFLAQADLDRLLTAEGYTFTKTWNVDTQQWSFTITGNSAIDAAKAEIGVELDSIQEEIVDIAKPVTFSSIPMLCGQPMMLFGNGTPQESIVPINWIQFLDGGYNWTGLPSALGQVYINTAVNSGGRYTAVWNGNILKWVNS